MEKWAFFPQESNTDSQHRQLDAKVFDVSLPLSFFLDYGV